MGERKPTRALLYRAASAVGFGALVACGGPGAPAPRAAEIPVTSSHDPGVVRATGPRAGAPNGVETNGGAPHERPNVLPFGAGMSRPIRVSGQKPGYTQEAIEARVEGLMIVKCVIQTSGELTDCRIIKPLPYLDQSTLDALKTWRMTPTIYKGRPVAITYVLSLRFKLPLPEPPPVAP